MSSYSVAIRTLGKNPEILKKELESLHAQTCKPDKIIIYIAKGYPRPSFTVGIEQYVETNKGMVAQRAVPYDEISSKYILLLDDDVTFDNDCIARILNLMEQQSADCIALDTFRNHDMTLRSKIKSAISGLVFPHFNKKWAFKIHWNDTFSYINHPADGCYRSMSAAGPASMWTKKALTAMHFEHELWLDKLGFAYGDDGLEFYKLHLNGGKLMVSFDKGVKNLDAKTSSTDYHRSAERFYTMSKALTIRWHRMHFKPSKNMATSVLKTLSFSMRLMWQFSILAVLSISKGYRKAPWFFAKGIRDGVAFINSQEYVNLPPYLL